MDISGGGGLTLRNESLLFTESNAQVTIGNSGGITLFENSSISITDGSSAKLAGGEVLLHDIANIAVSSDGELVVNGGNLVARDSGFSSIANGGWSHQEELDSSALTRIAQAMYKSRTDQLDSTTITK